MRFIALFLGMVLPLIAAGCAGGGPGMKEVELTDAQKLFKTRTTFKNGVIGVEVKKEDGDGQNSRQQVELPIHHDLSSTADDSRFHEPRMAAHRKRARREDLRLCAG